MPASDFIVLTAIVSAFAIFAAALAWGNHVTSSMSKNRITPAEQSRSS